MKQTEDHTHEDTRLKALFHALPAEEMPERLRIRIVQQAAARHDARRARRSDVRGMVWAGVTMAAGIVGIAIFLIIYFDIKISLPAITMPEIQTDTVTPIWLITSAGAIALLVADTLLRRRIRNKEHKTDL